MSVRARPYGLTTPCPLCPFRSDIPAFLTEERVREIEASLVRAEFHCHETTGVMGRKPKHGEMHCAGALILLEKLEQPSQMMRIAERLGMYDRRKLRMDAPVFEDFDAMAEAQPERGRHRRAARRVEL
jgi:hypothetical protein